MPPTPPRRIGSAPTLPPPATVDEFLDALDHPLQAEIREVRGWILGADPSIREGVKWNAPSFRTAEYFATFHLRSTDAVQLVFHTGAKARDLPGGPARLDAGARLATWLGKDRCLVTLGRGDALAADRADLEALVRAWIAQL